VTEMAVALGAVYLAAGEIRYFVQAALALGIWYLGATFVIPLGLIGIAYARGNDLHEKGKNWTSDATVWVLSTAAVVTLLFSLNSYAAAVGACNELKRQIAVEQVFDRFLGRTRVTQAELDYAKRKCDDLPFTSSS
jgi:hypothetical protein